MKLEIGNTPLEEFTKKDLKAMKDWFKEIIKKDKEEIKAYKEIVKNINKTLRNKLFIK